MKSKTYTLLICKTIFGTSSFCLGVILLTTKMWIFHFITSSFLVLKPNNPIETAWRKHPQPIPTDVYLFNWTNPEDLRNLSTKPKFQQVGPYRFMQDMEKVNLVWNDNNTVTFSQIRTWHFDNNYTRGSLSDNITTMDVVMLSAAHYTRNWNYFLRKGVAVVVGSISPEISIRKTVDELLFAGYDNAMVYMHNYFPFVASEVPRYDKFGWFAIRNGSADFDGVYNMGTGINGDFDIHNWNYYNTTHFFEPSCAKITGSGGELYSSKITKDYLGIFYTDVCRYLRLDFEEEVMVDGILGYKYSIGDSVLDNGTLIEGNECYCNGQCIPSGMLNVSSCRYGFPVFASLPNFYKADPIYADAVEGVAPEKDKHETYVVLEPTTSIPLKVVGRLQLNMLLHPMNDISTFRDIPEIYFPVLWVEQQFSIPPENAATLKLVLLLPLCLTIVSIILIIAGMYILFFVTQPYLVKLYKNHHKTNSRHVVAEQIPLRSDACVSLEKSETEALDGLMI